MSDADRAPPRWLNPAVEWGPALVFLATYLLAGLFAATAAVMAATALAFAVGWRASRRLPMLPLVTLVLVAVFGGLTLWLRDETFIKMKPTVIYGLFAAVLLAAYAADRPLLHRAVGGLMPELPPRAWRVLTLRYGLFFAVMAGLNEAVWRTQSTDFWVTYKVFGGLVLLLAFVFSQAPFIARNQIAAPED